MIIRGRWWINEATQSICLGRFRLLSCLRQYPCNRCRLRSLIKQGLTGRKFIERLEFLLRLRLIYRLLVGGMHTITLLYAQGYIFFFRKEYSRLCRERQEK